MFVKTISYEDWNGEERTEDFRFNLTRSELVEIEADTEGGIENYIKEIGDKLDAKKIMAFMKMIIAKSYGEKSLDGKRFIKDPEISKAFMETPAYDQLFMELVTDADAAATFISKIIPQADVVASKNNTQNQNGPKLVEHKTENNDSQQ